MEENCDLDQNFQKIEDCLSIGQYDVAKKLIHEMLSLLPDSPKLYCYLTRLFLAKNNLVEAKEACETALRLDPEYVDAKLYLGNIYMYDHQHCKAEEIYLAILHLYPEEPYLYLMYSHLMYKTGHLEKAQKLLERCLQINPEYDDAHAALASVLAERKNFFSSLQHGKKGVELSPTGDISHYSLGISFYSMGRPFKARHHLREALRLDPNDSGTEKAFLQADFATRWLSLPVYYFSWICDKIPGEQFTLWAIFVAAFYVLPMLGVHEKVVIITALAYLGIALYSWVSYPLTKLWIKLRPPK
ncbi:tetratricopeptide repeat protein [Candidatus Uabimicrobium sp. HlEnr_7]|uniref:tetratricopeptide repeat protein n=1 Tax=Candidatus Uabimicrobium helgolandensis TaxID=3095367 RepID=UPI003558B097